MKIISNASAEVFCLMGGASVIIIVSPKQSGSKKVLFEPTWQKNQEETLSLEDIRIQVEQRYGKSLIMVIAEYPLRGSVYLYGNYEGAGWIEIGTLSGYA